jgi:hypothetical protein
MNRQAFGVPVLFGFGLLLTGCYGSVSSRIPTVPVGASEDIKMCEQDAASRGSPRQKRSEEKRIVYAACMIARGYESYVAIPLRLEGKRIAPIGYGGVPMMVRATTPHSQDTVVGDLQSCVEETLVVLRPEVVAKASELRGSGAAGFEASGLPMKVSSAFGACLEPRQYQTRPWERPARR